MRTIHSILKGVTGAAILSAAVAGALAADGRSYVAGKFALELDGINAGWIHSVEGGDVAAEVVTITDGTDLAQKKHLAGVKYGEFTMRVGPNMPKPVYDWITDTVDQLHPRKNGAIIAADFNFKERQRASFENALITEITIPASDAGSKDPAYLTVKLSPELVKWSAGGDAKLAQINARKQKAWLPSNFRLEIAGLDCSRVSKIDAFTIKQQITENAVGETREAVKVPGKIEYPNLRITLPASHAASWLEWSENFIIKGNNGDDQEKDGTLTFLTQDLSEELVRVSFHNLGIFRVHRSLSASGTSMSTVTVELYLERLEIDFMAQFEK